MMETAYIEFLVEEPSIEATLRILVPRLIPGTIFDVHAHQGKPDLLRKLPDRLRGYASWLSADARVVVVVDRDDDDCRDLKARLDRAAVAAGLHTRSAPARGLYHVVNRIVVEEIEAWFIGDWAQLRAAYPRVSARSPFRDPEQIRGGTWEALERVLQKAGYFPGGLRKIEVARAVAAHLAPDGNRAHSFVTFRDALRALIGARAAGNAGGPPAVARPAAFR